MLTSYMGKREDTNMELLRFPLCIALSTPLSPAFHSYVTPRHLSSENMLMVMYDDYTSHKGQKGVLRCLKEKLFYDSSILILNNV